MKASRVAFENLVQRQATSALEFNAGLDECVWGLTPDTALRAHRFRKFVDSLSRHLFGVAPATRAVLCVIAYEGITTLKELACFLHASSHRILLPGAARVSWERVKDTQNIDARSIHFKTELALRQVGSDVDWLVEVEQVEGFLSVVYPGHPHVAQGCLDHVLEDAKAWLYLKLPSYLLSHVLRAISMPILPDAVIDRLLLGGERTHHDPDIAETTWLQAVEDVALDISLDLANNQKPSLPFRTIEQLKSVCSIAQNETGIRLSTHLNKSSTQIKVSLLSNYLATEGWIAATATSWVMHLLTFGSLRKGNPAMSTISTYIQVGLLPLCKALQTIGRPPGLMTQVDWLDLHTNLIAVVHGPQSAAVLASIHVWAIRTYGCEPMHEIIFSSSDGARVHKNVLWPKEQNTALRLAYGATADERTNSQCMVILALGIGGLFRIGELPALTTSDFEATDQGLRIKVDPGRGLHGGKSIAARRVVRIEDATAISLILNWVTRRNEESQTTSTEEVLVFGDPKRRRALYRFGQCTRLVNQILKQCSGDDSVSFHTLRHTGASMRMLRILEIGHLPLAVDPLDETCHEIGHEGPSTLAKTYAHLFEFALRRAIDRALGMTEITSTEAASWLNKAPTTLRQQKRRSQTPFKSDYFASILSDAAWGKHPPGDPADMAVPLAAIALPVPSAKQSVDLKWVLHALDLLQGRTKLPKALLQLSCSEDQLVGLCQAIASVFRQMNDSQLRSFVPTLLATASIKHHLDVSSALLRRPNWSFKPNNTPVLTKILKAVISRCNSTEASTTGSAWLKMQKKGVLDLEDVVAAKVLLDFLNSAGLPPQCLVYRRQKNSLATHSDEVNNATLPTIESIVTDAFDASVRIEEVEVRRGFPFHYLLFSRKPLQPGKKAAPATLRMSEFHGLFFTLCIFWELKKMGWTVE